MPPFVHIRARLAIAHGAGAHRRLHSLRKHALAVEAAMRACAVRYGEAGADVDEWGIDGHAA